MPETRVRVSKATWAAGYDPQPPRLAHIIRFLTVLRDLITTTVGCALLYAAPPSVQDYGHGLNGAVFSVLWSLLPLCGGLLCLYGVLRRSVNAEVIGAFTISSGFGVWTYVIIYSLITAPGPVPLHALIVSLSISGAFVVLALSALLRGLIVAMGWLLAGRKA